MLEVSYSLGKLGVVNVRKDGIDGGVEDVEELNNAVDRCHLVEWVEEV